MEGPATAGGVWFRPVASATGAESTAGRSHNKAKSASDKQGCPRESAVELGARAGEGRPGGGSQGEVRVAVGDHGVGDRSLTGDLCGVLVPVTGGKVVESGGAREGPPAGSGPAQVVPVAGPPKAEKSLLSESTTPPRQSRSVTLTWTSGSFPVLRTVMTRPVRPSGRRTASSRVSAALPASSPLTTEMPGVAVTVAKYPSLSVTVVAVY